MVSLLLSGVAAYRNLPQLPSVLDNLVDLQSLLGGVVVADRESPSDFLDPLAYLASTATDTLIFYFGGHGVRDLDDQLCLALPGTIDKKSEVQRTALPVERVMAVMNRARARNRIVILDCCFSGQALRAPSAYDLHLLTATGRTEKARAPETRNTLFTGGILDLLRNGIPDAGEWITVGDLHRWPVGGADDPTPHQRCVDDSADVAVARNPAYGTAVSPAGLRRRAELATRVGWRDPARAARLFGRVVADAWPDEGQGKEQDKEPDKEPDGELMTYRMSEAAWLGTSGDVTAAVARWERIHAETRALRADTSDIEQSLAFWRGRLSG